MLTLQEVAERTFTQAKKNGYTMSEVDDFLDEITRDYGALQEENATLRRNLKILADRINEYRETEDLMRTTLYNARKSADDMIAEAEAKREGILDALEQDIRTRKSAYDEEIAACRSQLTLARAQTASYLQQVQEVLNNQQSFLNNLPDLGQGDALPEQEAEETPAEQEAAPAEEPVGEAAPAGDTVALPENVTEAEAEEVGEAAAIAASLLDGDEAPAEEPVKDETPAEQPADAAAEDLGGTTTRIDFSNLKFGKGYEIK